MTLPSSRVSFTCLSILVATVGLSEPSVHSTAGAQGASQPNPYQAVDSWAKLPEGRQWVSTVAVDIDPDGRSIWVFDRCGANTCIESTLPAILKFDPSGKLLTSFGAGMFVWPHGLFVDKEGNVWVTDGRARAGKGQQVFKFSPDGSLLMRLGTAGVSGRGHNTLNQPSDVIVAPDGTIFVADGHDTPSFSEDAKLGGDVDPRIVKFTKDGKFIKAWGRSGNGPGEFSGLHGLAFDSQGRLFVNDRWNNRIQIFDQNGRFLDEWKQFGRPSGIYISKDDTIYVVDSESSSKLAPGSSFQRGIRIGSAKDGSVRAFIPEDESPEAVAVDAQGTIYGSLSVAAKVKRLKKWVKK